MVLYVPCFDVSFCTVSPVYLYHIHPVNRMFSLICLFVALVVSHFGLEGRTLLLIASVPGYCLLFSFFPFRF